MAVGKEKKSFKKYAKKHLAGVIETRRKTAKAKKEKLERLQRRKLREATSAAQEEAEHQEQLARLRDTDASFYAYLESEEPNLLQFGHADADAVPVLSDDDEAGGGGSDAETDEDEDNNNGNNDNDNDEGDDNNDDGDDGARAHTRRITRDEIQELTDAAATLTATKDNNSNNKKDNSNKKNDKKSSNNSTRVVERCLDVMVCAARELKYTLREGVKPSTSRKFEDTHVVKDALLRMAQAVSANVGALVTHTGAFRSHKTRYLVKRAVAVLTSVLTESSSSGNSNNNNSSVRGAAATVADATLTTGLLHAAVPFVPLLHYLKGMTRALLRVALLLCGVAEEAVRVAAYLLVRAVATRASGTRSLYQSAAFKGIFLALVRCSHTYTAHQQPAVAFLLNAVVDLYGTDLEAAYQHTFVYLRQLAIYLRAVVQQQSLANVRAVVNWQYVNALRVWGAVVSTYAQPAQLGPLIHPVVQIALGLMDVFASPRMFALHLHVIEVLNHIGRRAEGVYVPVAPYLLRILTSPSVALDKKSSSGGSGSSGGSSTRAATTAASSSSSSSAAAAALFDAAVELPFTMRVKKSQARSRAYHIAIWHETLYLLTEHMATHSHTLGFPEAFWVVDSTLRRLRGEVKVPRVHAQLTQLLRAMQATAAQVTQARESAAFGPCDLALVRQLEERLRGEGSALRTLHERLREQRVAQFRQAQAALMHDDDAADGGRGASSTSAASSPRTTLDRAVAATMRRRREQKQQQPKRRREVI